MLVDACIVKVPQTMLVDASIVKVPQIMLVDASIVKVPQTMLTSYKHCLRISKTHMRYLPSGRYDTNAEYYVFGVNIDIITNYKGTLMIKYNRL